MRPNIKRNNVAFKEALLVFNIHFYKHCQVLEAPKTISCHLDKYTILRFISRERVTKIYLVKP